MPSYTTLQSARTQGKVGATELLSDTSFAALIPVASRMIDVYCGQNFDIRTETHAFNGEINGAKLILDGRPLLSATTVLNGDGTTLTAALYDLLPKYVYPKEAIRVILGTYWVPPVSSTWQGVPVAYAEDALAVTGEYGYVPHYATAWQASGVTVGAGGISASATSLPISLAGVIDVGHVLKIGTEQLRVSGPVALTSAAVTLTVERGYNGTTAAAHVIGDAITIFKVDEMIEIACSEFVNGIFRSRDSQTGKQMNVSGFGSITIADMPDKVREKLIHPLWNWRFGQVMP